VSFFGELRGVEQADSMGSVENLVALVENPVLPAVSAQWPGHLDRLPGHCCFLA